MPRVDVETVLLCDVLPDGTVAGVALVEPIYDTNTGARVATRTVDPATGTDYAPAGTLQACAPDGCTATTTALVLCDAAGDGTVAHFVRTSTYDCEGQLLGTLDRDLDGATYTPAGTVGACPVAPACESPTTPTATIGLCLPDGTPIAVTVVRDCQGAVTSEGWIDLRTGTFSAGAPPVGTVACGDSQSVQVSGTFCDIDGTGDVVGLVLIEYSYAADGTIASVRLVDATTGATYTPVGEVTTCPAGVEQPEQDVVQLCDIAADGTSTPFIRDYRRNEVGAIVGHSDYTLGGTAYTPAGTVGTCGTLACETLQLCDSSPAPVELGATALDDPGHWRDLICPACPPADNPTLAAGLQALFDGGSVTFPLTPTSSTTGSHHWAAGALTAVGCSCPDALVTLTVSADFFNNGPASQQGGGTGIFLYDGDTLLDTDGTLAAAGTSDTLTLSGTVPLASIQTGSLVLLFQVEGGQQGSQKTWTVSDFSVEATTDCGRSFLRTVCRDSSGSVVSETDTLDGTAAYTPVGDVQPCSGPESDCESINEEPCASTVEVLRLCDLNPDVTPDTEGRRCAVPFLRHLVHDCSGALAETRDTAMDGVTPYTPVAVVDCGTGGVPAQTELVWPQTGITEDPAGVSRQDFIYTVTNPETGDVAEVRLHASSLAGGSCGAYVPTAPVFNNPTVYTLALDAAAQEMTVFRLDLADFDTFEGATQITPPPSRVEGDVTWNGGSTVTANTNNVTAYLYWDNPPAQISYRHGNTGGGLACSSVAFQGLTLKAEGCCGCSTSPACQACETLVLCDGAGDTATITGSAASGTLSNGVTWTATGATSTGPAQPPTTNNGDGAWWGLHSFPHTADAPTTWTFSRPSVVEFSVYLHYNATTPALNTAQLPTGLEAVHLPEGYSYSPATGVLTRTSDPAPGDPCTYSTDPQVETSARFRTTGPVTTIRTAPAPTSRIALCGRFFTYWVGALAVSPGMSFLRTICRDCDGAVTSATDTLLDGETPYTPTGTVGACLEEPPCNKSVLSECIYRLPDTATGFDTGSAAFPGCWLGTATNPTYAYGNRVTSWEGTYQSSTGTASQIGFTSPDLGGVPFTAFTPAIPVAPTQTASGYQGTAVLNGITVTLTATAGNGLSLVGSALSLTPGDRVRLDFSDPVRLTVTTSAFADPPTPHNERLCGVVAETVPWQAVKLADCEGAITVVDQDTREALPANATLACDCCEPVQVCISATDTETIEFISNEAQVYNNTLDTVWTWTNTGDANGPAAGATWYQMYRSRYTFAPAAWSVVDSAPARKAGWISPHPNGATATTGAPGEGPTLSGTPAAPMRWWAKAAFSLPSAADPNSIRVKITVLNADQVASRFRLNSGAWTSLPASATYNGTPYTFGPGVVAGAQPGTNTLFFEVLETVPNDPGNGAGVMAHVIVTYDVPGLGQRSWTRMVCCDGSVHYVDEHGDRQDELPPSSSVVPCGSSAQPMLLCDDAGTFIRHVSYVGDQVLTTDTDLNGSTYAPVGPVRSCGA
ncbi:hypothetical protein ACWF2L_03200 [Streptomyces anulatus]